MSDKHQPSPEADDTHVYYIRIQERLGEQWQDWFEGITISHEATGETILTGQIIDQAHLFGLLRKIRNLGLTLISVTRVHPDDNP